MVYSFRDLTGFWKPVRSQEAELYQRQIARPVLQGVGATDREIDKLVYELYGLTPDEIAIVEGQR